MLQMKDERLEEEKRKFKAEIKSWDWNSIEEKIDEEDITKDEDGNEVKRRSFSLDPEKLDVPPPKQDLISFHKSIRVFEQALLEEAESRGLRVKPGKGDPLKIILEKKV